MRLHFWCCGRKLSTEGITHEKSVGSLAGGHLVAVNRCRVADTGMKTKTNRNTDRNENSCADSDKNPNA